MTDTFFDFARPAASAAAKPSLWVKGPVWDGVWMLNAIWLLPLVLWLAHGKSDPSRGPLDVLYFAITATFWIGHRLCSTWLAYCTEAYRPLLRAQPLRFIAIPLAVMAGCFAILLPADWALPWTRGERIVWLAILDYGVGTYHFGAQHFGALSLYRTRAGRGLETRTLDRWFALGVGGGLVFLSDILAGAVSYQDRWIDRWLSPALLTQIEQTIRLDAMVLLLAATIVMLFAELSAQRRSLPRVLYILGLAGMVAVALQPRSLFLFLVLWTSQHWILATGLATRTPNGEPAPGRGRLRRALHALNTRPWAILVLLALVSVLLLPVFEVEAVGGKCAYYGDRIFGGLATGLRTSSWVPALVALGFATGFIHYLHDRNVYRLSDPSVRAAAKGLLARPQWRPAATENFSLPSRSPR
jgi:hypothetical protein